MAIVDDPRIVCLDAILERERLGLDKDVYDEVSAVYVRMRERVYSRLLRQLCNSVTLIMHNAWCGFSQRQLRWSLKLIALSQAS